MDTLSRPSETDEVHDLQLVLLASGVISVVLGSVVILAEQTGVLDIPAAETLLLCGLAGAIASVAWLSLRVHLPVRRVAWSTLVLYTVIISVALHYTGGPQTPMPAFYLLVIVAASFVLGRRGANLIAGLSVLSYALLLFLEYTGTLPIVSIWRVPFDARNKGALLIINWLAVATPAMLTAFLGGSLAERLKTRNQRLRDLEQLRKEMVELLVHDLRNPLTVMLGGLDVINMTMGKSLSGDQRQLFDNARRSGHFMLMMIGDMLNVAKLEAGRLTLRLETLNIKEMLDEAVEQVRVLAELDGLTLALEPLPNLPAVRGDRQLIQRVLANLVSNAVKFTPSGCRITVSARLEHADCLAISVRDTGEGIPPEKQTEIFEKFGQWDRDRVQRRGTGLGLTFSKMAVEAHGGRIWVESAPGQGSIFTFTLPTM